MTGLTIGGVVGAGVGGAPLETAQANVRAPVRFALPDPDTLDDAAYARRFVAPLTLGFCADGWSPMRLSWQGHSLASDPAYWSYLADLGVTHIRLTFPYQPNGEVMGLGWTGDTLPPLSIIRQFLDLAETIMSAGLVVLMECSAYLGQTDIDVWRARLLQHIDNIAQEIVLRGRARFPTLRFAIGPFGALMVDPGAWCNDARMAGHRALRSALPGYVLLTGAGRWGHPYGLLDVSWTNPPDNRCIAEWRDYGGRARPWYYQGIWRRIEVEWSPVHAYIPAIGAEIAGSPTLYASDWADMISDIAMWQPLGRPTFAFITDRDQYNFGVSSSDPTLRPAVQSAVVAANALIRASRGWQAANGNPAAPL